MRHRAAVVQSASRHRSQARAHPEAHELVNVIALAMRAGMKASDLKQAVFAYPMRFGPGKYVVSTAIGH